MTVEPQYEAVFLAEPVTMGAMAGHTWTVDPKRLGFTLARYKFVAKMLAGQRYVLEVGCADAWATKVVAQVVEHVVAVDFDESFVGASHQHGNVSVFKHDMTIGPRLFPDRLPHHFDAAFALDVIEHIKPSDEGAFLGNVCLSIRPNGVFVVGTPSLEAQTYASPLSKAGHVNCKTHDGLRSTMQRYFENVFMFGMNDETVHTGYGPMCHYLFAVCACPKT